MTNCFVQEYAGPAGTKHNFHFTSRSFTSVELQNGLACRFFGEVLGSLFAEEEVQRNPSTTASAATGRIAVCLCDAAHVHACQRLGILSESSVGAHY